MNAVSTLRPRHDAASNPAGVRLRDVVRAARRLGRGPVLVLAGRGVADAAAGAAIVCAGARGALWGRGDAVTLSVDGRREALVREAVGGALRRLLALSRLVFADAPAGLAGVYGVVGFEAAGYFERLMPPARRAGDPNAPDLLLVVPHVVCTVDEGRDVLRVYGDVDAAALVRSALQEAQVQRPGGDGRAARTATQPVRERALRALDPPGSFVQLVRRAQTAIAAGDVYQIVLSQVWEGAWDRDPWDVYAAMQRINPSPYMVYCETAGHTLVGASPEMLCRVRGRRAAIRPLAGTRRRPAGRAVAAELRRELQCDPKERAEHIMLVDLARNDLSRVCRPGSVRVEALCDLEAYSHVVHMVSHVEGDLAPGCDAVEVLRACFPAGTVSGAPKLRALQLIAELEGRRRGWYAGSLVRMGADGSLDASLVLRSALFFGGRVRVQAGAGIVAASVPEREDAECRAKAQSVMAALGMEAAP